MEIARLMRKRQLNVQQQNALAQHEIYSTAVYWRTQGIPNALFEFGVVKGLSWGRSILLNFEIDFPGMAALFGNVVTDKGRFFEFEIETDRSHTRLVSVERWDDVTAAQNFSLHNKGIGIGYGALALAVQIRVNQESLGQPE